MDARIFLIRHGETEWSAEHRYTGSVDLPLTPNGEKEATQTRGKCIGPGKLIDEVNLRAIYCSPLRRARRTAEIMFPTVSGSLFRVEDSLMEWDYGTFEGLTYSEINRRRPSDCGSWDLWTDGCPGGEFSLNIKSRLEPLILKIKEDLQISSEPRDIVCVTHRHIAIALALLLTGIPFQYGAKLAMETAGVIVLNFDKILVRWNSRPTKAAPVAYQASTASPKSTLFRQIQDNRLAAGELKALDYFQAAVWPLLSTATQPCPPPISLALESEPVLLAMCELAEAHRLLQQEGSLTNLQAISNKRLTCLSSVRKQLRESISNNGSLSQLLVAVLLLYFLDGFIDCGEQSASTISHQVGVRAIVEQLGGFNMLVDEGQKDTPHMLLSEFASTDLTRAILDDRAPCFPARIWRNIEKGTVWWEKQTYGVTLAVVFRIMTQIAFHRQSVRAGDEELSIKKVRDFERSLQPRFSVLRLDHFNCPEEESLSKFEMERVNQTIAFTRAFQHSALIYFYRALQGL
ncbi:Zn(II)2Cys6 transcription factor [Penicillium cinerascens]|uniref:Zn(II)2Cys6 transcription factor n=1 Tax=Penicillium cinerascens TaxID=70096 RepID=A0A9W9MBB8_9EURO|nr:Zn(II)2Cys6 transcription factor [Penicillium cinerascens]KAJ5195564.1 Zn(II)2Cys6 transcription factor [Penicillium cinerascens]